MSQNPVFLDHGAIGPTWRLHVPWIGDAGAAQRVRVTGGEAPEKQAPLAQLLASDRSNHISGKLLHVMRGG